jgi:hypothetical protein
MRVRFRLATALPLAALVTACAAPARPDRLAMPLLGGARLADAWPADGEPQRAPAQRAPARVATALPPRPATAPRPRVVPPRPGAPVTTAPGDLVPCTDAATTLCELQLPAHLDLAALPAHHQETPGREPGAASSLIASLREAPDLRRLVGARSSSEPLLFAVAAASRLADREAPTVASGPDLVLWARVRATVLDAGAAAEPGDLLVFDRVVDNAPASLVAVAIGRDDRGVTEIVYLAGGIVRRGFVDASRPRVARDGDRRIVNSFLRHGRDWPPDGTRYLAGELLSLAIRLR